jgi:hypothetical protein
MVPEVESSILIDLAALLVMQQESPNKVGFDRRLSN